MPAGNYGEVLLEVADQLCAELAYAGGGEVPGSRSTLGEEGVMSQVLSPTDESLVTRFRASLAKIAAAVAPGTGNPDLRAVQTALDGAELVVRGELVSGNEEQLPRLMPSFVFLVTLPAVGQNRAIALSQRTSDLVKHELEERA